MGDCVSIVLPAVEHRISDAKPARGAFAAGMRKAAAPPPLLLAALLLATPPSTHGQSPEPGSSSSGFVPNTPDTFQFSNMCVNVVDALPSALALILALASYSFPDLCVTGTANLCTADATVTVSVGSVSVDVTLGDGTTSTAGPWASLPDLIPGEYCDQVDVRLRDAVFAVGGINACIDLKFSCLPNTPIQLPCIALGDGVEFCTAITDQCECVLHPECGYCDGQCTRMMSAPTPSNPNSLPVRPNL